jgi:hypothetical protein
MGKSVTYFESATIETAAVVCSSRTHQNMDALDIVSRILNTEPEMENFLATYNLCKPGKAQKNSVTPKGSRRNQNVATSDAIIYKIT